MGRARAIKKKKKKRNGFGSKGRTRWGRRRQSTPPRARRGGRDALDGAVLTMADPAVDFADTGGFVP